MITLQMKTSEGPERTVIVGPADMIRFERAYNVGVSQFSTETMRYEWLAYLGWAALKREGATKLDFDAWVDTIETLTPESEGNEESAAAS